MADGSKDELINGDYSCFLFTKEDKSPMVFRLHPCREKHRLRPLIEAGGGQLTSEEISDAISLILPKNNAKSDDMVCVTFIYDCIKAKRLLDVKDYRVAKGHSFEPVMSSLNRHSKGVSGRSSYLASEDKAILRYLLSNDDVKNIGGNKVWRRMELFKVIRHSWQSAKDRFRKQILPNIEKYDLTPEEIEKFRQKDSGKGAHRSSFTSKSRSTDYSGSTEEEEKEDDDDDDDDNDVTIVDDELDEFDKTLVRLASRNKRTIEEPSDEDRDQASVEPADDQVGSHRQAKKERREAGSTVPATTTETSRSNYGLKENLKPGEVNNGTSANTNNSSSLRRLDVRIDRISSPVRLRSARIGGEKNSVENVEPKTSLRNRAETAVAGSPTSKESRSVQNKNSECSARPSSSKDSPAKVDSAKILFPRSYSPRFFPLLKRSQQMKKTQLSRNCSGETESKTNSQMPTTQEVNFRTGLRSFVVNSDATASAIAVATNNERDNVVRAEDDKTLTTCNELMSWLDVRPTVFAHAMYLCNGSVDNVLDLFLGNSNWLWDVNDDANLFSENESTMKVLEQKYGRQRVAERMKFLDENPVFL